MLTAEVRITIPGAPATKGSMKCVGQRGKVKHALVDDHASTKPYVDNVVRWCREKWPRHQRADEHQPVDVYVTVSLPRPQAHYGTGRNAGVLKARYAGAYPVGANTGDSDKYARAVLDALQAAGVLHNDAQVVDEQCRKRYVADDREHDDVLPYPGVVIRLYPI